MSDTKFRNATADAKIAIASPESISVILWCDFTVESADAGKFTKKLIALAKLVNRRNGEQPEPSLVSQIYDMQPVPSGAKIEYPLARNSESGFDESV